MDMMPDPILSMIDLRRSFRQGEREIRVLAGATAHLRPGEAVALVGPSGAGKSTLLHTAGRLETPDAGSIIINGRDCAQMNDAERTRVRRVDMGFVYQFHQLLPEFSAAENVMLPQLIRGYGKAQARARAIELLEQLGLGARVDHRPAELSGGEQQRTAIARALANRPHVLLADEPTGNLDPETSDRVFSDLVALIERAGVAALIATHNMDLARRMHRVLRLSGGVLEDITQTTR
jgi:lipoprotein-releasing system ATP-binding protein